jgi:hypothetical protein
MIKLREWNALSGQLNHEQVAGHIKGIYFEFRGTAQAAQIGALADVTEIKIDWAKRNSAVVLSMTRLAQISTLKGGRIGDRANTAGAFYFGAYYPCTIWGDDNAYFLTKKDNFNIQVKFSAALTSVIYANATFSIFLDEGEGLMKYMVGLEQLTQGGLTANSTTQPIEYTRENVVAVYVTPSTNIDALQVSRGGSTYDMTFEGWRNTTWYKNAVESNAIETTPVFTLNSPDMAELWLAGHGSYSEMLVDGVKIVFDSAATAPTPDLIFLTLDFLPDKLDESAVAIRSKLTMRTANKQTSGHARPIQVINKLQNPSSI